MPRRHKNARQRDRVKRLKCTGICVRIPVKSYRVRNDTKPGWVVAEAWPRTIEKDLPNARTGHKENYSMLF